MLPLFHDLKGLGQHLYLALEGNFVTAELQCETLGRLILGSASVLYGTPTVVSESVWGSEVDELWGLTIPIRASTAFDHGAKPLSEVGHAIAALPVVLQHLLDLVAFLVRHHVLIVRLLLQRLLVGIGGTEQRRRSTLGLENIDSADLHLGDGRCLRDGSRLIASNLWLRLLVDGH